MKRLDESVRSAILMSAQQGMLQKDIAARYLVSEASVSRLIGNRGRISIEVARSVLKAFREGVPSEQIATSHNIAQCSVQRIINGETIIARRAAEEMSA